MTKEELYDMLTCDESYRIERTVSTGNMDKFQEAIYLGKDHLGNNRVVIDANHYVYQTNNYYPFGATWNESSSSTNNQAHKYNGKELDRMHGLDFYDYGARNYDAALGIFTSMDPLCEKYYHISPYAYCGGNPVKYIDPDGKDPGDFFRTMDEAAIDFGMVYNACSIYQNKEYGASIFKIKNAKGEVGYTYTVPKVGKNDETYCSLPPLGQKVESQVHSHGAHTNGDANNVFSGEDNTSVDSDLRNARENKMDIYLSAPNGTIRKYEYAKDAAYIIYDKIPSDTKGNFNYNDYPHSQKNNLWYNKLYDQINVYVKSLFSLIR